LLNIF